MKVSLLDAKFLKIYATKTTNKKPTEIISGDTNFLYANSCSAGRQAYDVVITSSKSALVKHPAHRLARSLVAVTYTTLVLLRH